MTAPVNVAVIGYGFMGVTHTRAFLCAARDGHPCRVRAVCDPAASSLAPPARFPLPADFLPELDHIALTDSLDTILADPTIHLLSICTPTHTHIDVATRALRAGKHVLLEKPVSLHPTEIDTLDTIARGARRLCMPAMCIRFWPAWAFIAGAIRDGRFGPVRAATFQRLACPPDWAPHYAEHTRSGGPLFDLHIHDTDFILHALGAPTQVETTGDDLHFTTRYTIPPHDAPITAEASWAQTPDEGFVMRARIEFDDAGLGFEFDRTPQLIVTSRGVESTPPLPDLDGYDMEVRALLDALGSHAPEPPTTLRDAAHVTRILHAERRSLKNGALVAF